MPEQSAQLKKFLHTMGPGALSSVRNLRLTECRSKQAVNQPLDSADIAILLASACPNITHLATDGVLAESMACEFGALCPNISTFEIAGEGDHCYENIPYWETALLSFPRVKTLLAEGRGVLEHTYSLPGWYVLPSTLEEIRCYQIPSGLEQMLPGLHLDCLRILHAHERQAHRMWWDISSLAALLKKAPHLHTISTAQTCHPTIFIGRVTLQHIQDLLSVFPRLDAKLMPGQLKLGSPPVHPTLFERGGATMGMEHALKALPPLPYCIDCHLFAGAATFDSLAGISRVFPSMRRLALFGEFSVGHLSHLLTCQSLEVLDLHRTCCSDIKCLIQLLVRMPNIYRVQLPCIQDLETADLRAMISAAYAPVAAGMNMQPVTKLGDWHVITSSQGERAWERTSPTGEPPRKACNLDIRVDFQFVARL